MAARKPDPDSSPPETPPRWMNAPDVIIARVMGILCIAAGFMMGIHGLDHPGTAWLASALGVLVTGLLAQAYALIRTVKGATSHIRDPHSKP